MVAQGFTHEGGSLEGLDGLVEVARQRIDTGGQALFLGDDRREFWQRTEDRGRRLAEAYNGLGLAEYEAIESFKRYSAEEFLHHAPL